MLPVYAIHCFNHFRPPLGLGLLLAEAKAQPELRAEFDFSPSYYASARHVLEDVARLGSGVFLFADYTWNVDAHLVLSRTLKELDPHAVIVHGGPSVPRGAAACEAFLKEHPQVDFVCCGEAESTLAHLLTEFAGQRQFEAVQGSAFLRGSEFVQPPPRARKRDLDGYPSPYLTGEFERLLRRKSPRAAIIETNRGCPYMCTFCDWGQATLQKIHNFSMDRVKAEIEWVGMHQIPVLELADANFGIFERDLEIAEYMCEVKGRYGFPKELNANHAKNATSRVTEIVRMTRAAGMVSQGVLALQTRDEPTLKTVKRHNLPTEKYDTLLREFRALELPIVTELMIGLPGSTYQSLSRDLQWICDRNLAALTYPTVLLPNTPMANPEYRRHHQIKIADETAFADPGHAASLNLKKLQKQQVVSTLSYSEQDYVRMLKLVAIFNLFHGDSLLKYLMFFLRWDREIPQLRFLDDLLDADLGQYPLLRELRDGELVGDREETLVDGDDVSEAETAGSSIGFSDSELVWNYVRSNRWPRLYEEARAYIQAKYQIAEDSAFAAARAVQEFVMAYSSRVLPASVAVAHDFALYFRDKVEQRNSLRLSDYPPAQITVLDPLGICAKKQRPEWYDPHVGHYELGSNLTPVRVGYDIKEIQEAS